MNTLKFAHACKKIQNVVVKNKFKGTIPAGTLPVGEEVLSTMDKLKQKAMPYDGIEINRTCRILTTKVG